MLHGLGKWFKKFARINGALYQFSGKKNQQEHISLQVQVILGPEFSCSGAKGLHGYRKDPVIRSISGHSRRKQCRNFT